LHCDLHATCAQPEQLGGGRNLLAAQNLDYYPPPHQAELFRLRALFDARLGEPGLANAGFATALALFPQLANGWLSWGAFCDAQAEAGPDASAWLESAVVAYLQVPPPYSRLDNSCQVSKHAGQTTWLAKLLVLFCKVADVYVGAGMLHQVYCRAFITCRRVCLLPVANIH